MTPEAQRIAIAEACGWKQMEDEPCVYKAPKGSGENWRLVMDLPDYLSDLNAMHEAEKVLTESQYGAFVSVLYDISQRNLEAGFIEAVSATAAQRAEAFLRTLGLYL